MVPSASSFCVRACLITVCIFSFSTNLSLRVLSISSSMSILSNGGTEPNAPRLSPSASDIGLSDRYCIRHGSGRSNVISCIVTSISCSQSIFGDLLRGTVCRDSIFGSNVFDAFGRFRVPRTWIGWLPHLSMMFSIGCGLPRKSERTRNACSTLRA